MITANEGFWLTQSESNEFRPRIFVKRLPVNYPQYWTQWTDEQKQAYEVEHGTMSPFDLLKYMHNFDYSHIKGGVFGGKESEQ